MPERRNKNLALYSICKPVHYRDEGLSVVYDFDNFKYMVVDWGTLETPASKFKVLATGSSKKEMIERAERVVQERRSQ
jgi:hypothetical protein